MNDGDGNPCRFTATRNTDGRAPRKSGRIFFIADLDKPRAVFLF